MKKIVHRTGVASTLDFDAPGEFVAEYPTIVAATNYLQIEYLTGNHRCSRLINSGCVCRRGVLRDRCV